MAKRLTREEKREQAVVDLINEMFRIAGHDVTYDDVVGREDQWFNAYTMTEDQYNEWKKWGKKYLMKKLGLYAFRAEKEMSWVSLMWGLRVVYGLDFQYEQYCTFGEGLEEPDWNYHVDDPAQNCTRLMTKEEFAASSLYKK